MVAGQVTYCVITEHIRAVLLFNPSPSHLKSLDLKKLHLTSEEDECYMKVLIHLGFGS